jgi:hypothetical protein
LCGQNTDNSLSAFFRFHILISLSPAEQRSPIPQTITGQFGASNTALALRLSTWWEAVCPTRIIV